MALTEDEVKCAKCGVKWKNHGGNTDKPGYHPMFWSNIEFLEWESYEKDYRDYVATKKAKERRKSL